MNKDVIYAPDCTARFNTPFPDISVKKRSVSNFGAGIRS